MTSPIFRKYLKLFRSANWLKVSVDMEEVDGVWVESKKHASSFIGYLKDKVENGYWYFVDPSGLDDNGVDRYDEFFGNEFSNSKRKIDGRRL